MTTPDVSHGFHIFRDGDMWCAVGPIFRNLQEDSAGFGETPLIAYEAWWIANRMTVFTKPDFSEFTVHSDHKHVAESGTAWQAQDMMVDKPHAWIQWKGTNVCMDVHCLCGYHSHVDDEFAYYVVCPMCQRKWMMNGHVEMIEVDTINASANTVKRPPLDEDEKHG